jgi:formate hydrogenlyase subunit 6/NADH:ubiquinone oxidoreductase subunit I
LKFNLKFERYGAGLAKGMAVTIKHLMRRPITTEYPEQRLVPSKRTRGNELIWDSAKCLVCTACAKTCPQGAIRMVTSPDPTGTKSVMTKIEIDFGYCISCGLCVESCPYNALHMGYSYERSKYRRGELVHANEQLYVSEARPASAFLRPDNDAKLPAQTLLVEKPMSVFERAKKKEAAKPEIPAAPPEPPAPAPADAPKPEGVKAETPPKIENPPKKEEPKS